MIDAKTRAVKSGWHLLVAALTTVELCATTRKEERLRRMVLAAVVGWHACAAIDDWFDVGAVDDKD